MLRVTEIFRSIQGESSHAGRPCAFVRLTGCPMRCVWCDSEYTFTGGERMSLDDVMDRVRGYGCNLVEITGGEPLAQAESFELIRRLCDEGFEVLIETSGSIDITPVDPRAKIILDVKCPGSGEVEKNLWKNLDHLRPHDEIKFVIADRADYEWARDIVRETEVDLALVDIHLSDGPTGVALGRELGQELGVSVLFMTANPGMVRGGVAGTIGVLSKPTDERAVQTAVDYALRRRQGQPVLYAPPELQLFG